MRHGCELLSLKIELLHAYCQFFDTLNFKPKEATDPRECARLGGRCLEAEAGAIVKRRRQENRGGNKFRCGSEDHRDRA